MEYARHNRGEGNAERDGSVCMCARAQAQVGKVRMFVCLVFWLGQLDVAGQHHLQCVARPPRGIGIHLFLRSE
jgi:hypothetical protein